MKRRKLSKGKNKADDVVPLEVQYSGLSLTDIPWQILVDILLRLPIKGIIICKYVCKTLHTIISDPEFTKLHFAQVEVYPLIRKLDPTRMSRILYLVQLEQDQNFMGRFSCHKCCCYFNPSCGCHLGIKLDSKLKLPFRKLQLLLNDNDDANAMLNCEFDAKRNRCIKLRPKDHKFKIANSCNGLLCLSEPSDNNPIVVCNPVTGEFINLPEATKVEDFKYFIDCGLGFCPNTNKYKVVRIFKQPWHRERDRVTGDFTYRGRLAEVHTLGTGSWKDIGYAPYSMFKLAFPTYLNGALHWFCLDDQKSDIIVSFDIEKECFQSFPSPPWASKRRPFISRHNRQNMSMGVLRGCLFICDSSHFNSIRVWVMQDYGVKKSWTKVYSIHGVWGDRLPKGLYLPIKHLHNGALLMFYYSDSALVYYKRRTEGVRYFKIKGAQSSFEVFAHTPSIISLKDILAGDNVEVLSIWTRYSDLKLEGESRDISLIEDTWDLETDSDSSYERRRVDKYLWQKY